MSYYVKHYITIEKPTLKKLEDIRDFMAENCEILFVIDGECLTDEEWNAGLGSTWHDIECDMEKVSEKFPEEYFNIHCITKENMPPGEVSEYNCICHDGYFSYC